MRDVGPPHLVASHWPADAYPRADLPERVLQFGTGMLLRALSAAALDAANRAGRTGGRIVVVQSTPRGAASAVNAQAGLFTLVERGLERGERVERACLVGLISRALVAGDGWGGAPPRRVYLAGPCGGDRMGSGAGRRRPAGAASHRQQRDGSRFYP